MPLQLPYNHFALYNVFSQEGGVLSNDRKERGHAVAAPAYSAAALLRKRRLADVATTAIPNPKSTPWTFAMMVLYVVRPRLTSMDTYGYRRLPED